MFLAHEFQHLISFEQKDVIRKVQDDIWLNELRSEIAPTLVGYDGAFVYTNSNLEARTKSFMKNFSDAILNWEAEEKDYASINLFGQYVLDHYGRSVIASMTENNLVGIESFNAAIEGFLHVIKTQRNMRIHFIIAIFILLLGIYFNFNRERSNR